MKSVQAALSEIRSKEDIPFSISFVKYDASRRTGGAIENYKEVILCHAQNRTKIAVSNSANVVLSAAKKVNPNHRYNDTINVRILSDGLPTDLLRKIHTPLILSINKTNVTV